MERTIPGLVLLPGSQHPGIFAGEAGFDVLILWRILRAKHHSKITRFYIGVLLASGLTRLCNTGIFSSTVFRKKWHNSNMARKAYTNIESQKSPFGNYYSGHSNIGLVKITGSHGFWDVYMGRSIANDREGLTGLYVGRFRDFDRISSAIERLEINKYESELEDDRIWITVFSLVERMSFHGFTYDADTRKFSKPYDNLIFSESEALRWLGTLQDPVEIPG